MDPHTSDDSTLEIRAPKRFNFVRNLDARLTSHDPRTPRYVFGKSIADLRACTYIGIEAILWCAVFLSLARQRGSNCELLLPNDQGASDSLESSGVREILSLAGVRIAGCNSADTPSIILPMCVMQSFNDVEDTANRILDRLASGSGSIPPNLHSTVTETFVELANNGVEHSQSDIGTLGIVKLDIGKRKGSLEIAVADGGVGIRQTLNAAACLDEKRTSSDWSSVEYATGELVSGTGDSHRGIGLFGVSEDSRLPSVALRIHSGNGILHINESSEFRAFRSRLFPGTLVYVSIQFPLF